MFSYKMLEIVVEKKSYISPHNFNNFLSYAIHLYRLNYLPHTYEQITIIYTISSLDPHNLITLLLILY